MEIGGTAPGSDHDQIDVVDTSLMQPAQVQLDGTLAVELMDPGSGPFAPTIGDGFTLLKTPLHVSDTVFGTFAAYDLPAAAGGRRLLWDVLYSGHEVTLKLVDALAGNYNGDGTVDLADYTVWRDNLGSTSNLAADGDQRGTVDSADYTVWKNHFGQSLPPSPLQTATIPEPASVTSLLLCLRAAAIRLRAAM